MFHHRFADIRVADIRVVLGADESGVDAHGLTLVIFNGHLRFAVRAQPGNEAAAAHFRQLAGQFVGQVTGHGHQGGGFITGKPEHHTLVAGANGFDFGVGHFAFLGFEGSIHTHGNIAGLAGNG